MHVFQFFSFRLLGPVYKWPPLIGYFPSILLLRRAPLAPPSLPWAASLPRSPPFAESARPPTSASSIAFFKLYAIILIYFTLFPCPRIISCPWSGITDASFTEAKPASCSMTSKYSPHCSHMSKLLKAHNLYKTIHDDQKCFSETESVLM